MLDIYPVYSVTWVWQLFNVTIGMQKNACFFDKNGLLNGQDELKSNDTGRVNCKSIFAYLFYFRWLWV